MNVIEKKLNELEQIVEKYQDNIPVKVVADFLNMNEKGLKAALMRGNVSFGFGYQKTDEAYRVFVIPTVPFYLWFTNTQGRMIMRTYKGGELV